MKPVILLSMLILNSLVFVSPSYAHNGHIFDAAIEACKDLSVSNKCQYVSGGDKRFKGTCQVLSGAKLCVRNQPIEFIEGNKDTENPDSFEHHHENSRHAVATDLPSRLSNPLLTFF